MTGNTCFSFSCNEAAGLRQTTRDMIRWHVHVKCASNLTSAEGKKPSHSHDDVDSVLKRGVQVEYIKTKTKKTDGQGVIMVWSSSKDSRRASPALVREHTQT